MFRFGAGGRVGSSAEVLLMKKLFLTILALVTMLMLAGCGGTKPANEAAPAKVLKVAAEPVSPPFELYLEDKKVFTGFDVDLINGLAKEMGYDKVEIQPVPFKDLLKGLEDNKYDLAMCNFSYTKERAKKYAASDPYAKAGFAVIANEKTVMSGTPMDYEGRKIAIMENTSAARFVKTLKGSAMVGYPSYEAAIKAVSDGAADYAVCGNLTAYFIIEHTPGLNVKVVGGSEKQDDLVFYMNKKNTALQEKVNAALHEFKRDGEYKKLIHFYFGEIEKQ